MIATGLLWFDDDTRRPIALKIAEAAERYRERVGYEPTTCELSPAQAPDAVAATLPPSGRARKVAALPRVTLHVEPNDHLKPNYILVGVAEGETPRPVRGWVDPTADEPAQLPSRRMRATSRTVPATPASATPVALRTRTAMAAKTASSAAPRDRSVTAKPTRNVAVATTAAGEQSVAPAVDIAASAAPAAPPTLRSVARTRRAPAAARSGCEPTAPRETAPAASTSATSTSDKHPRTRRAAAAPTPPAIAATPTAAAETMPRTRTRTRAAPITINTPVASAPRRMGEARASAQDATKRPIGKAKQDQASASSTSVAKPAAKRRGSAAADSDAKVVKRQARVTAKDAGERAAAVQALKPVRQRATAEMPKPVGLREAVETPKMTRDKTAAAETTVKPEAEKPTTRHAARRAAAVPATPGTLPTAVPTRKRGPRTATSDAQSTKKQTPISATPVPAHIPAPARRTRQATVESAAQPAAKPSSAAHARSPRQAQPKATSTAAPTPITMAPISTPATSPRRSRAARTRASHPERAAVQTNLWGDAMDIDTLAAPASRRRRSA